MSKKSKKSCYDTFYCVCFQQNGNEFLLNFFTDSSVAFDYAKEFSHFRVEGQIVIRKVSASTFYNKYVYKGGD